MTSIIRGWVGVAVGDGVSVGEGEGVAVGTAVSAGVGVAVSSGIGVDVGSGLGDGVELVMARAFDVVGGVVVSPTNWPRLQALANRRPRSRIAQGAITRG